MTRFLNRFHSRTQSTQSARWQMQTCWLDTASTMWRPTKTRSPPRMECRPRGWCRTNPQGTGLYQTRNLNLPDSNSRRCSRPTRLISLSHCNSNRQSTHCNSPYRSTRSSQRSGTRSARSCREDNRCHSYTDTAWPCSSPPHNSSPDHKCHLAESVSSSHSTSRACTTSPRSCPCSRRTRQCRTA